MDSAIVETRRMVGHSEEYTGKYRLIGVPGNYIDLPGRGGKRTQDAATRALACFVAGGTNAEAQQAAHTQWAGVRLALGQPETFELVHEGKPCTIPTEHRETIGAELRKGNASKLADFLGL